MHQIIDVVAGLGTPILVATITGLDGYVAVGA